MNAASASRGAGGFSLIELMIAMVLGLLVVEGIYILFAAAGRVNTTQTALSRLQENGRIAIELIANDLRAAGRLACGSSSGPLVYADSLASHIIGAPAQAAAPAGQPDGTPYALDRSIFLGGSTCVAKSCTPAVGGVPQAGLGAGDKVPGTDVLMVRYLQGDGLTASGASQVCNADGKLAAIDVGRVAGDTVLGGLQSAHLALLAGCTQAQIFPVAVQGSAVQPVAAEFGTPSCVAADAQTRLFDLDAQLQTSIYYLQLANDEKTPGRKVAALMRRTNGIASEVVQGVERLDLRYSLTDAAGNAHWLNADELGRHASADGAALQCKQADSVAPCSWRDVDAVEISLLANTVDDLPDESAADAWDYRYSVDGEAMQRPVAAMPVTGLPAGRMLRREFRTVVALRGMAS
ncbi:MAG: PilW family protein [Rudaea sp.]|uniref:PilW family protein n=1 Tax=Rudaea sp. TaxID=2136325 RepID=UPI0039E3DE07